MRNLKLCFSSHLHHPALRDTRHIASDPDSGVLYAVGVGEELIQFTDSQSVVCTTLPSPSKQGSGIASIDWIIERQLVCIIRLSGEILTYDPSSRLSEVAAIMSVTVCAACWSPDQDVLHIASDDHCLRAYSPFFELLIQKDLNPAERGCAETVNVGWGSKETQFHGSEGKVAAKAKQQEAPSVLLWDDKRISLSWRRDGQLIASSSIDPVKGYRVVRIWNRDLELQYTCEVVDGLEPSLSWKPSGEVIAVSRQKFQKHEICLIEKNGLFLSSFRLPFAESSFVIEGISWASDSSVLCIWGRENEGIHYLMLWCVKNSHWYLKQTYEFEERDSSPSSIVWDPVDPLTLHLMSNDGTYCRFKYMWHVCRSNDASVAVIDGMQVLVTPFNTVAVPPPMSAWKAKMRDFVNDVAFDSDSNLIICSKSSSVICTMKEETHPSQSLNQIDAPLSVFLTEAVNPRANIVRPAFWIDAHPGEELQRLSLLVGTRDGYVALSGDRRSQTTGRLICWSPSKCLMLDLPPVIALASDSCGLVIAIEFADKTVMSFDVSSGSRTAWKDSAGKDVLFPQPCRTLQISCGIVFGLTDSFSLYRNNDLLLRTCCTSFVIHQNSFLVYTTTSHVLMLAPLLEDQLPSDSHDEAKSHPIERGSKLVTTTSSSAILQTPRGNLELVCPRPFLWLTISSLMQERAFLAVFKIMRKHRMNFNLLIDRYTDLFMDSIEMFIDDVSSESVDHLVLFLTSLSDHVYKQPMKLLQGGDERAGASVDQVKRDEKITLTCRNMRDALIGKGEDRFLHPILLTLVMCGEVDKALFRVKLVSQEQLREEALSFLLYFVSVNDLFHEAIGTYDFDVVRMVAQKSQKDPKEYLKTMQQLQSYEPEYYMKYKIDVSLGRFVRALKHVSHCEDERIMSEVLDLVESRKLFKDAVVILLPDNIRKKVWHNYADYLLSKKYYNESAIAYKRSGDRISAIRCHQLSGNWNQAISESLLLHDPHQLKTLCLSLIDSLKSSGRRIEAALIADKYLSDADSAVSILIEGCEWDAARRLMAPSQAPGNEQLFRQTLNNEADRLIANIRLERESLTTHVNRLLQIRQEKEKQAEEHFSDDAMSDVSSVRSISRRSGSSSNKSLMTRASGSSAHKRDVRKWAKLKAGSRFEDVATVLACKEIICRTENMQHEVGSLLRHLIENESMDAAHTCRQAFRELLMTAKSSQAQIWIDNLSTTFRMDQSDLTSEFVEQISRPMLSDGKWDLVLL